MPVCRPVVGVAESMETVQGVGRELCDMQTGQEISARSC